MSTTEENRARFRRTYEEVLNKGDVSVVDELIAPDFFNHAAPPATNRGPESLRGLATILRTAFPDLRFTIEESLRYLPNVGEGRISDVPPCSTPSPLHTRACHKSCPGGSESLDCRRRVRRTGGRVL